MIFNEWLYFIGLCVSVLAFHQLPYRFRPVGLVIAGVLFYGYYAGIFAVLLVAESILIYSMLKKAHYRSINSIIVISLATFILGWFKYRNMLLIGFEERDGVEEIIVPLAISFFTFEFIHYAADHRRGTLPKHNLWEYMAFIFFFPSMVAGPIKRIQQFLPEMREAKIRLPDMYEGGVRILIGLFKKIVIADSMTLLSDNLLGSNLATTDPATIWLWVIAYTIKIYMDFSGYSDIAIGSARLFGITLPENFNWPYLASNISHFWKRWHMSLTTWIRDYLFIPLGGSRVALPASIRNTFITMGICGLWHGAAWHFVAWGLYHAGLLSIYRIYSHIVPEQVRGYMPQPLAVLLTFTSVAIGWVFFILPVDKAGLAIGRMLMGW